MKKAFVLIAGLLLASLLVLYSMTYTIRFHQVAIKTDFGKKERQTVVTEPGLHFKLPFLVSKVVPLDTRLQLIESPIETITTVDQQQQVLVQAFLLWRIDTAQSDGPLLFYQAYENRLDDASNQFQGRFREAIKTGLSRFTFDDLVGAETKLAEAEQAVLTALGDLRAQGVLPVTVGISQVLLPANTTTAVMSRMQATRASLASAESEAGSAEANAIQGRMNTTADKIRTFAQLRADEIRAQGSAEAAKHYRELAKNEEFATFLVQLKTLEEALGQYVTVFLPSTAAPWHLMNLNSPISSTGIPQPSAESDLKSESGSGEKAPATPEQGG